MPDIVISDTVRELIRGNAIGQFLDESKKGADGMWVVPVSSDTYDRLVGIKIIGESFDNLLTRIISYGPGPARRTRYKWH